MAAGSGVLGTLDPVHAELDQEEAPVHYKLGHCCYTCMYAGPLLSQACRHPT